MTISRAKEFPLFSRLYSLLRTLLIAAAAFFLAAAPAPVHAMEIEIWDFPRWLEPGEKTDRFAWIKKRIRRFEELEPGIKVKLAQLSWNSGQEKLKIAALGNRYPDVAPGTIPLLFIKEGLIEPINPFLEPGDADDYLPSAMGAYTIDGQTYGWPFYMAGELMYLNRSIFASAGAVLPVNGRWTTDEFTSSMEKIRDYQKTQLGQVGHFPMGMYFQKEKTANFPFLFAFGGTWVGPDLMFRGDSPEIGKGLAWVKDLIARGVLPPDTGGKTEDDVWSAFSRDHRLAAAAAGLWGVRNLTEKYPMDFEVAAYPAPEGKSSPSHIAISGFYVFSRPDQARVKAAMKLARFLTSPDSQKDLVRHTQFPTRRSVGNLYPGNPHMTRAWEILQNGRNVLPDSRWPQMDEEIQTGVQSILLGKAEAPQTMTVVGEKVKAIITRQSGSIRKDLQKGSIAGTLFLWMFVVFLAWAWHSKQIHLWFIAPALSVLALFLFYPLGDALVLAFREFSIGSVGDYTLANFTQAFSDEKFLRACKNTILYTCTVVPANVMTALIAATLIASLSARWKSFFRAMYYLPGVASVVVLTMVWKWLFNYEAGLFNTVLAGHHFEPVKWLTDPDMAFWSIILTGIVRSPGGAMLVYLAAMANIPTSLYEAADLEGASGFQKWWNITVPLMKGTTMFLIITGTIDALQVFAQVLMLTDGGPGISTSVVVHRIYTCAFRDFNFGVSSAMALLLFVAILAVTLIQRKWAGTDSEFLG